MVREQCFLHGYRAEPTPGNRLNILQPYISTTVPAPPHFSLSLCFSVVLCSRGILVSQPKTEPVPPAVKVQSPKHWSSRKVPTPLISDIQHIKKFKHVIFRNSRGLE